MRNNLSKINIIWMKFISFIFDSAPRQLPCDRQFQRQLPVNKLQLLHWFREYIYTAKILKHTFCVIFEFY